MSSWISARSIISPVWCQRKPSWPVARCACDGLACVEAYGQAIAVAKDAYGLYADTVGLNKVFRVPSFEIWRSTTVGIVVENVQQGCSQNQGIRHLVVAGRMSLIEPFCSCCAAGCLVLSLLKRFGQRIGLIDLSIAAVIHCFT